MLQWSEAEESSVGEKQNLGNFFFILEKNRLQVFNFLRQDFPETLGVGSGGIFVDQKPEPVLLTFEHGRIW